MIAVRLITLRYRSRLHAAFFNATRKRERDRNADDEEEERKDEIGRRPAMPFRVLQRPVDAGPRAGIIYEHHAGDRDSAKNIERDKATGGLRKSLGDMRHRLSRINPSPDPRLSVLQY